MPKCPKSSGELVVVDQADLDAVCYAHHDIVKRLEHCVATLAGVLSAEQIGPLKDIVECLKSLSTAEKCPTPQD